MNPNAYIGFGLFIILAFIALARRKRKKRTATQDMPLSFSDIPSSSSRSATGNFELTVEDVFTIKGRGTVVTGKISKGTVKAGDILFLQKGTREKKPVTVNGIEMFRKLAEQAKEGDEVGLLLGDLAEMKAEKGDKIIS